MGSEASYHQAGGACHNRFWSTANNAGRIIGSIYNIGNGEAWALYHNTWQRGRATHMDAPRPTPPTCQRLAHLVAFAPPTGFVLFRRLALCRHEAPRSEVS